MSEHAGLSAEMREPRTADLARDRQGRLWEFDGLRGLWRCRSANTAMSWKLLLAFTEIITIYHAKEAQ
ncbi:hypothetical protein EDF60_1666 [Leucobacter luti]|nr:hypothetical protein [Leucobacter luti]TCK41240.1 hypothetical protein EDF60_1666 [Leucobacter luti]